MSAELSNLEASDAAGTNIQYAQSRIDTFVSAWMRLLHSYCHDNQRRAIFHIWAFFLLALRSLGSLASGNQLLGCFILARSCLEYNVSIAAIIEDATLADAYLAHRVDARNRYLDAKKESLSDTEHDDLQRFMACAFGTDFPKRTKTKWYPRGFRELCKTARMGSSYSTYVAYCQIAHGTSMGGEIMNTLGLIPDQRSGKASGSLLEVSTEDYLRTTRRVLARIFGDVWTPEKSRCLGEFDALVAAVVSGGGEEPSAQS